MGYKFKGNPSFPIQEPQYVAGGATTNVTDVIYCIDTLGNDARLSAGMMKVEENDVIRSSEWANQTFNGVLYGRWTEVGADVQLACYKQIPIN